MSVLDPTKLGTSQLPAIVNVDRYATPFTVYTQIVHGYSEDAGEPAEWGNRLEPVILQAFAERFSLPAIFKPETRYPPGRPWSRVSVDSLALPAMHLECKAIGEWRWRDEADEWGEDGSAKVPARLRVQVTGQLEWMRSEADFWRDTYRVDPMAIDASHVAVLVGGNQLRWFRVPFDPELGGLLFQTAERFITDYVLPKRWPPADDSEGCGSYLRRSYPKAEGVIRPATLEESELVENIRLTNLVVAELKSRKDALENQLRRCIGPDLGISGAWGGAGFTAKNSNRAGSTQWKAVAEELAAYYRVDLAEHIHRHKGEGSRTLSVKFGAEK